MFLPPTINTYNNDDDGNENEEARPLASSSNNNNNNSNNNNSHNTSSTASYRIRQKERTERRKQLRIANLEMEKYNQRMMVLWKSLKKNSVFALIMFSGLINVFFLWEKVLMKDGLLKNNDDNDDDDYYYNNNNINKKVRSSSSSNHHRHGVHQKTQSILYPNSQFGMCQHLPFSSPQQVWSEYIGDIFQASRLPSDDEDILFDLRAQMLAMVSPKLPLAVKTLDKDWTTVSSILEKGWKRWEYLQTNKKNKKYRKNKDKADTRNGNGDGDGDGTNTQLEEGEPPYIRIVVMGGSVTFGDGCKSGVRFHEQKTCSWPYRLNSMLKDLFGDVVVVSNIAVGGTNTATGTKILQYDTLADETDNADIIINSYASNDNLEDEEDIFEMIQSFCRQVLQPHPCKFISKPLLIYFNDALGDDQKPLMESTNLPGAVEVLANYYGFGSISYVDVVKQWVYGDSSETWFSPDTHWEQTMPGQGMHITTFWIVSYYFLSMVTTFCSLEAWNVLEKSYSNMEIPYFPDRLPRGLPPIRNETDTTLRGKPRTPPQEVLPPRLDTKMTMHDVSKQWAKLRPPKTINCPEHEAGWKQCPFSWVSDHGAIGGAWLRENIGDKMVENSDWILEPPHITKPGFRTPDGAKIGSHMTVEFSMQPHPINRVVVFTYRGHTEKWLHSEAQIEVLTTDDGGTYGWAVLGSKVAVGYQNRTSSKMEAHDIELNREVDRERKMRIRITLTSGKSFKLMGLALCSS